MDRSIAFRNLAGGSLGGALGILVSWYVAPMALPFGVLLGVTVGWWADDIVQMSIRSFVATQYLWRTLMEDVVPDEIQLPHSKIIESLKWLTGVFWTKSKNGTWRFLGHLAIPFFLLSAGVRALARAPGQFARWACHPSSTAIIITIGAIVVGAAINAIAIAALWPWPETKMIGGGMSGKHMQEVPVVFWDIVLCTGIATLFPTLFGLLGTISEVFDDNPTRSFYARWETYSKYSPATYFARQLFRFFKSELMIAAFFALAIIYWVTLGGILIALVVIPVATFATFMVGLYKIAQRSAHWWCLGVTLTTTAISALIFYGSFDNEVMLWTVALCTGLVSGATTEALRRIGLWWSTTATGQHYLGIWYDDETLPFAIATPAWRTLLRAFDYVGQRALHIAI